MRRLLEEVLDSGRSPDEVCREAPELLDAVREGLARARAVEAELEAMFPTPRPGESPLSRGSPTELPRIPGYEIEGILGRGGMGVVYRARHLALGRPVAIKMLLAGPWAGASELERFSREAAAIARMQHPNIVQVHDFGEVEGRPYFTMELVEGGSLAQRLVGAPLPARESALLLVTLARAVHVAHESCIVHRDLKPANILLAADGAPKVSDFGLARRLDGAQDLTLSGLRLGTPSYMAPEQALGRSGSIGTATDIYALGAILYELLTGRPPFRAESASETERQLIAVEPVPPRRLNPRAPRDLETIALRCLEKEPSRRYGSAQSLAEDLERFLRGEPIRARPVGRPERLVRWTRRNPAGSALVAALFALAALATVAGVRELSLAATRRAEAVRWRERLAFIHDLQESGRFGEARAILGRVPDGGSAELRDEIGRAQRELAIVERFDAIRSDRATSTRADFGHAEADREYQEAFESSGLGTLDEPDDLLAARIAATGVRGAIVAAIDDWAMRTRDPARRKRLLEIARRADPDPWRDRVRDPGNWLDAAALDAIAADIDLDAQPVTLLIALAEMLGDHGRDGAALLRRVQAVYPGDFWVNFTLAETLGADDDAIGFYRAALALRPSSVAAHVNLGNLLIHRGRVDEAVECWEQALAIRPTALAHYNLAAHALNSGDFDEAIEQAEATLRLDPEHAIAREGLGRAQLSIDRFPEAAANLRLALDIFEEGNPRRPAVARALERAERFARLDPRLAAVIEGRERAVDPAELASFAELAYARERYDACARLHIELFAASPEMAEDLDAAPRYLAACSAALAAAGAGVDAGLLAPGAREARRKEALRWLREDLAAWTALAARDPDSREGAVEQLRFWQRDGDLAGVRDPAALERLGATEREEWLLLWRVVERFLAEAEPR